MQIDFKPVRQRLSDDCVRCAVASIFGLSAEEVPHFYRMGPWFSEMQKWLTIHGWTVDIRDPGETLENLQNADDYYMGNWYTEKAAHAVVMQHGKVVWNPSGARIIRHHNNCVFLKEVPVCRR